MRSTRRRATAGILLATAVMLIAGGLTSCADPTAGKGPEDAPAPKQRGAGGAIDVYLYQKPTVFNPTAPAAGANEIVDSLIYDSLVGLDGDLGLTADLAKSWDASPDGRTFTFHLRKGISWSDGEPFTSGDVLWSYTVFANPKSGSAYSANFAGVTGIDDFQSGKAETVAGFSAPDENTFVIKTDQPHFGLVALVGGYYVMPKHVLGDTPLDAFAKDSFWSNPKVGLGPYQFVAYKTDQYVELKANPKYRTKVGIEKIYLRPVTSDVATASLGNGEMDVVQVSPTDLKTVQAMKDVKIISKPDPGFIRIAFDLRQQRFQDPRVRQAFLYAIDRQAIVDKVLAGKGRVQNSVFMGDAQPADLNAYSYDPKEAKQLLTDAGWDSSKPVVLEWIPGQRDRDSTATVVESQLNAVGVKLKLKQVQTPDVPPKDGLLFGGGNYVTDPYADRITISCKTWVPTGGNLPRYCNKKVDALITKANATMDKPERMALYQQAAKLENADAPYLWLYNPDTIWAYSSRLKGLEGSGSFTGLFWNVADWSLAK